MCAVVDFFLCTCATVGDPWGILLPPAGRHMAGLRVAQMWEEFLDANPLWRSIASAIDRLPATGAADYDPLFSLLPLPMLPLAVTKQTWTKA